MENVPATSLPSRPWWLMVMCVWLKMRAQPLHHKQCDLSGVWSSDSSLFQCCTSLSFKHWPVCPMYWPLHCRGWNKLQCGHNVHLGFEAWLRRWGSWFWDCWRLASFVKAGRGTWKGHHKIERPPSSGSALLCARMGLRFFFFGLVGWIQRTAWQHWPAATSAVIERLSRIVHPCLCSAFLLYYAL